MTFSRLRLEKHGERVVDVSFRQLTQAAIKTSLLRSFSLTHELSTPGIVVKTSCFRHSSLHRLQVMT